MISLHGKYHSLSFLGLLILENILPQMVTEDTIPIGITLQGLNNLPCDEFLITDSEGWYGSTICLVMNFATLNQKIGIGSSG